MHKEDELHYSIALGQVPGIGPVLARQLISYYGSAGQVFSPGRSKLEKIPGIGPKTAFSIRNSDVLDRAGAEMEFCLKNDITIVLYHDCKFPRNLRHCSDCPYLLYVKGNIPGNGKRIVSIVGSRKATYHGKKTTASLVREMAGYDIVVVSGLALGIDGQAHDSSLQFGVPTTAVLAHGLDLVYPAHHRKMAGRILEEGGSLISEYISGTPPERMHFPARNRIVAGMADAVVVVESGERGGALITADIANSYGRDVFAIPGRVTDPLSEGCNKLINTNRAALIRNGADLFGLMGWDGNGSNAAGAVTIPSDLNEYEQKIFRRITHSTDAVHLDELIDIEGLDQHMIQQYLLRMELNGIIRSLPGNSFAKA